MNNTMQLRAYQGKKLLSELRGADYAHAGEVEAIELVFEKLKKSDKNKVLDAGCGLGGTAYFIQSSGWGTVTAFDIEPSAIKHAKAHYPSISFLESPAETIDTALEHESFDIIYAFNAFYAFEDQAKALSAFSKVAGPNCTLALFDYSCSSTDLVRESYTPKPYPASRFNPILLPTIQLSLYNTGWRLTECIDITAHYIRWYQDLIDKLHLKEAALTTKYGTDAFTYAKEVYTNLLMLLQNDELGGHIILADSGA